LRGPVEFGSPTPGAVPARNFRPAWASIDLGALRHNIAVLQRIATPAALCAVVKADGYGHGGTEVAKAAVAAGVSGLAVALVEEAIELRDAGITNPILLLSEPPPDAYDAAVAAGVTPTLYSMEGIRRIGASARLLGTTLSVHIKVDTGMHRVGAAESAVAELAQAVVDEGGLRLEGLWTHLAAADGDSEEDRSFTRMQLQRFDAVLAELRRAGHQPPVVHAANSAAAIAWPEARYNLVRCGISLYGPSPGPAATKALAAMGIDRLRPVMSLHARVSSVRTLDAGERPSYGRLRPLPERSVVATVPLGYADGLPRALFDAGFQVLIGGRRYPLAGMVTMDQIVVDCGPQATVAPGDEVVLLGRQGEEEITVEEWARLLGTISYEVLLGIGPRVPRVYSGTEDTGHRAGASPPIGR
jgi:alanine racemase